MFLSWAHSAPGRSTNQPRYPIIFCLPCWAFPLLRPFSSPNFSSAIDFPFYAAGSSPGVQSPGPGRDPWFASAVLTIALPWIRRESVGAHILEFVRISCSVWLFVCCSELILLYYLDVLLFPFPFPFGFEDVFRWLWSSVCRCEISVLFSVVIELLPAACVWRGWWREFLQIPDSVCVVRLFVSRKSLFCRVVDVSCVSCIHPQAEPFEKTFNKFSSRNSLFIAHLLDWMVAVGFHFSLDQLSNEMLEIL